jgi:glycine oxidase
LKSAGVVGAGIVGRLLALHLLKNEWQVTLFDSDKAVGTANCSYVAAGMLSPLAEIETAENIIFDLGMKSMDIWASLLKILNKPVYFQRAGTLLLSHVQDLSELKRIQERLKFKFKDDCFVKVLSAQSIAELEPDLSHWQAQGLYLAQEGQIDNRMLLLALASTLLEQGVLWQEETFIQHLEPNKVISSSGEYRFELVCDCRGLGAKNAISDLRGVRGELIYLRAPEVNLSRPLRLIHPRFRLYIVPRPNNIYIIGASEIESEDFSPISVRTTLELLSAAYSVHPGFAEARVIDTWVNCRPAFPDNLPRLFYKEGLLGINGLYRHGYLLAPILIQEAMSLIEKGPNSLHYPELLRVLPDDINHAKW